MVIQEIVSVPISARTDGVKKGKGQSLEKKCTQSPPVRPYQLCLPFPQKMVIYKVEPCFARFFDKLSKIYVNVPLLEDLKEAPLYLKFLRELFSEEGKLEDVMTIAVGEVCNMVFQSKLSSKLQHLDSFSIRCSIWDLQIQRALYDIGASLSLMPVSLCRELQLQDLKPTNMTIQLANISSRPLWVF